MELRVRYIKLRQSHNSEVAFLLKREMSDVSAEQS